MIMATENTKRKTRLTYRSLRQNSVKIPYPMFVPEWWDTRDWRLQFYDYVLACAEKYNTTADIILCDALFITPKRANFILNRLRHEESIRISVEQVQAIVKLCAEPFTFF